MEQTSIQIKTEIKEKAEAILQELGIPLASAYEIFYRQIIAHRGLPFEVRIPNETTVRAMEDAREGKGKKYADLRELLEDLED